MTSIAFASLFLGLVLGPQTVGVLVEGPVASVEIELDGKTVGRLAKNPWSLKVDLGSQIDPHELVARALNEQGEEVATTRQWLNLPGPPAQVQVLLERDKSGRAIAARLTWQSLISKEPTRLSVSFDGKPLALAGPDRVELPAYDADSTHLLTAELEFAALLRARTDVVLGGRSTSEAHTELTAVPVRFRKGERAPAPDALQGWFVRRGEALRVVASEQGPAQLVIVRDLAEEAAVTALGSGSRTIFVPQRRGILPQRDPDALRFEMRLARDDRMLFLWPMARRFQANLAADLFEASRVFTGKDGGIHWLLTRVYHPDKRTAVRRFSDAVAVAGLEAAGSYGARAVLLVLGGPAPDRSFYSPTLVRRYLETLHVPLFIWSLEDAGARQAAPAWGEVEDISSPWKLREAFRRLRLQLDSQQIVWLEGRHLPQEIELSEKARGIELVK